MKKFLSKLFGVSKTTVANEYKPSKTPLECRLSIEAKEIDYLISYLMRIRENLEYKKVINAADVQVTSQEVLKAAEHAKELMALKMTAKGPWKIIEKFLEEITKAGKKGYYGACVFMDCCTGVVDKGFYQHRCFKPEDYYKSLLQTVDIYVAIKELQSQGFKIRLEVGSHNFFITTDDNVADALKIDPSALANLKSAEEIDRLLANYTVNAKALYKEFPELFGPELVKEFKLQNKESSNV